MVIRWDYCETASELRRWLVNTMVVRRWAIHHLSGIRVCAAEASGEARRFRQRAAAEARHRFVDAGGGIASNGHARQSGAGARP